MSQIQKPKTPTKTEFLQLKSALKSWNYRTKEGRRFAKHVYLSTVRLIRRPIDVVGTILSEFTVMFDINDVVSFSKDLRDILKVWTTWLEFFGLVETVYSIREEVYEDVMKIYVEMDIEDKYWVFSITVTSKGLKSKLECFNVDFDVVC